MAVFKEKNGPLRADGYLHGRANARIRLGLSALERGISPHLYIARDSANARNVRAAVTTSDNSVRKGGASEKKSPRQTC